MGSLHDGVSGLAADVHLEVPVLTCGANALLLDIAPILSFAKLSNGLREEGGEICGMSSKGSKFEVLLIGVGVGVATRVQMKFSGSPHASRKRGSNVKSEICWAETLS